MVDECDSKSFHTPLLHLLLHVDALLLQQLPLSEGPVDGFCWRLSTRGPLSLQASLLRVIKAEHVAFPHDDTVSWKVQAGPLICDKTVLPLLVIFFVFSLWLSETKPPNVPDRRTMRPVTLFPLTYVSAPSHGSKTTHPVQNEILTNLVLAVYICMDLVLWDALKIFTFSLRACGAAESAVFVFDKMATQDNVLAGFGIFSANSEGVQENQC